MTDDIHCIPNWSGTALRITFIASWIIVGFYWSTT